MNQEIKIIAPSKNDFITATQKNMSINKKRFLQTRRFHHDFLYHFPLTLEKMPLKYVPTNPLSLITLIGVLFAPNSIYKTPLSSNTELFNLLATSFLLIPHKIHLKSTPFTFNIAMSFNS